MALVNSVQAIKLSGRSKASFYKDVQAGKVSKTVQAGKTFYDTSELIRAYGTLEKVVSLETDEAVSDRRFETELDSMRLQDKIRSLETVLRQKDELAEMLAERIRDKDSMIEVLKTQVLLIEHMKPAQEQATPMRSGILGWIFGKNR